MIDHALLHPTLSKRNWKTGAIWRRLTRTATVCVKPCDVEQAAKNLKVQKLRLHGDRVPPGANLTEVKVLETQRACELGASEVDMVINTGRLMSEDSKFVEEDNRAFCETAHSCNAKLKEIFENDYMNKGGSGLNRKEMIQKLCQICEDAGADWVKTSTGFGFIKQVDGSMGTLGATQEDVSTMVNACTRGTQVKAAGGVMI